MSAQATEKNPQAAEKKPSAASKASGSKLDSCESSFQLPPHMSELAVEGTQHISVEHPFSDLPALLQEHPMMMMTAAQKMLFVLNEFGYDIVRDPVYKIRKYRVAKLFRGEHLDITGGRYIVGQDQVNAAMSSYIAECALGQRGSKILSLQGPPGTGKTIFEETLIKALETMSERDPRYQQYTFKWKNLERIEADSDLGPEIKKYLTSGRLNVTTLRRSPFSLLPPSLKQHYASTLGQEASHLLGFDLGEFYLKYASKSLLPDPHAEALLEEYVIPYYKKTKLKGRGNGALTMAQYLDMLNMFVTILPKDISGAKKAPIIRPMEENVDINGLLGTSNIAAKLRGAAGALGFHFNGDLAHTDGGMTIWDDFYRNGPALLDFLLGVFQEGLAKSSESPSLSLDTLHVVSSNHSSEADANRRGDVGALRTRMKRSSMNLLLHPVQIAETLVLSLATQNFSQRKLGSTKIEPLRIKEVFPNQDLRGHLLSPDGRYVLYVDVGNVEEGGTQGKVEVAPHALEFLGWIAAATRLVVDPTLLSQKVKLSGLTNVSQRYFTDRMDRLRVITDEQAVDRPEVLAQLSSLTQPSALNEGDKGMAQRDLEEWFKIALRMAQEQASGNTLTVIEIRDALKSAIESNQFNRIEDYLEWLGIMERVASEVILPKLAKDVNRIVSSSGDHVTTTYNSIANELRALAQNADAQSYVSEGGEPIVIDRKRLREVSELFEERTGRPLNPNNFTSFIAQVVRPEQGETWPVWTDLQTAIEQWITNKNASTGMYKNFLDYFEGKTVGTQTAREGQRVAASLKDSGYNERSFVQALRFLYHYTNALDRVKNP